MICGAPTGFSSPMKARSRNDSRTLRLNSRNIGSCMRCSTSSEMAAIGRFALHGMDRDRSREAPVRNELARQVRTPLILLMAHDPQERAGLPR